MESITTKEKLTLQSTMLGMFPMDPSYPERGIPHTGLMPTGADAALAETPVKSVGAAR